MPSGAGLFYLRPRRFGIFTLLVGAAVRARRPTDQATLHFFWLSVAFFGLSRSRSAAVLDRVDWFFYWGDAIAVMDCAAVSCTSRWCSRASDPSRLFVDTSPGGCPR